MTAESRSGMTALYNCVRACDKIAPPVIGPAAVCTRESYVAKIDKGLRSNYLVTLQLIIERDDSIPSPGELTMIANRAVCQRDLEAERLA